MYRFSATSNKSGLVKANLCASSCRFKLGISLVDSVSNTADHSRTHTNTRPTSLFQRSALLDKLHRENQKHPLLVNYDPVAHNPNPIEYDRANLVQQPKKQSLLKARGLPHCAEPNLSNLRRYLSELPTEIVAKIEDGVQRLYLAAAHFQRISQILTDPRLTNEEKNSQMFDLCGITAGLTHTATADIHLSTLHKLEECLTKCFAVNFHSMSHKNLLAWFDVKGSTNLNVIHRRFN